MSKPVMPAVIGARRKAAHAGQPARVMASTTLYAPTP
jgi:hypothetical protein